jgi:uncharacterized membrane protein
VREKEIWKLGVVYFMFGFSYIIYVTFFVAYLTSEAALTPQKAVQMFALLGLASILSSTLWGELGDSPAYSKPKQWIGRKKDEPRSSLRDAV